MSSGCDVGGDDSVKVQVLVNNLRPDTVRNGPIGRKGWEQSCVDETPAKGDFTITLKTPESSARFVKSLVKAAAAAVRYAGKVGKEIEIKLPVERGNPDQIQIRWESAPASASGTRGAAKSKSASRKKR